MNDESSKWSKSCNCWTNLFRVGWRREEEMNSFKFIFPSKFPDMNRVIAEVKVHWRKYHKTKKTYTQYACLVAKGMWKSRSAFKNPVNVHILWKVKGNRKDPDNVSHGIKYILDGLVLAGVLHDDSRKQVNSIKHDFEYGCKVDSVEVVLEETK